MTSPSSFAPVAPASVADSHALRISDHELLCRIASGAYGEVWLARSVVGTLRAVKIVRRDRHESTESFEREFKGLQKFEPVSRSHEGLVDILTLGLLPDGAGFYYVMELADDAALQTGRTTLLSRHLPVCSDEDRFGRSGAPPGYSPQTLRAEMKARGALPADAVITLGAKLTAALTHLHAHGLVHRDVKPSNILFIGGEPKLADAGLVADVDDARSLVGTAGYIAPEGPGTPQADLYALGKVLYEAAFGKDRLEFPSLPFDVTTRHDHGQLLELNTILLKACATDARDRYKSAETMKRELDWLEQGKSIRRHHTRYKCLQYGIACLAGTLLIAAARFLPQQSDEPAENRGDWIRWTTNRLAWDAYVRAGNIGNNLTRSTHTNALVEYEQAVVLDPHFARARAEMALQMVCNQYGGMAAQPTLERARTEAQRALAQDPSLTTAWQALAIAAVAEHDLVQAEEKYRQALRVDPNGFFPRVNFSYFLINCGRLHEARRYLESALRINNVWPNLYSALATIEMLEGRLDEAIQRVNSGIAIEPNRANGYVVRGNIRWEQGKKEEAAADWLHGLRLSDASEAEFLQMQNAFRSGGSLQFIHARIEWMKRRQSLGENGLSFSIAEDQVRIGQPAEALTSLESSVAERVPGALSIRVNPVFRCFRDEPRFQEILQRLGFSASDFRY